MAGIAQNPTPDDLAHGVNANLAALFRAMATLPGGELDESGPVARHLSFPTNPMFKGAWATGISGDNADRLIEQTIHWFARRGAPFFFWWTGPGTEPADLGERLQKHGLLSMEEQQRVLAHGILQSEAGAPVMAADLDAVNKSVLERTPPGFVIDRVTSDDDLAAFKKVFVDTYAIPEWAGQAWVDASRAFGVRSAPWKMYLGRLYGEPVATNMLFCGGGFASIYAVATVPKAQNKGIGAAISLQPLIDARAEGYRHAVLFSTEMGQKVYERIGFRDTGARVNRYLWRAA